MNANTFELNKQRIQQLQHEAQNNRLAREARSSDQPANSVLNSVLATLGEQLVELGSRLQQHEHERATRLSKIEAR
jgi:uncharacterized membrane protein